MNEIAKRIDDKMEHYIEALTEHVAIPSVSQLSFDQAHMRESATWIAAKFEALGLETEIIELEANGKQGRPAILASREAEPGRPTILLYGHHDVQPTGDYAAWDQDDPFTAVRKGDRLYGRGAADDKAGVMLHVAAIENADPGVGIRVFIEGEEEVGSPTFDEFLHTYKDRLAADVIVVADSGNWKVGIPSLTTSLRGVTEVEVDLEVLDHALHSGMYGGPILDSVTLMARLIATLHDEEGNVAVEGLLQEDTATVDYPEVDLRADTGILDGVQFAGSGSLAGRIWTKPAIAVIGMDVTPTEISSNTISPRTRAHISLRVPPAQDPAEAAQALVDHLVSHAPFGAHVTARVLEAGPGFIAGEDTPVQQLAHEVLAEAFGHESVDIGLGGSIPFISTLKAEFPNADILVTGVEDPDTRAHSANESLHLGDWRNAIVAEALLLSRLGK
ncbi:acetylornithine deacetylase/succinyl-diaminopimelate desuccinylase-like protein [Arcanobacterium wilhelmae]|uniref:Acetylornithine deacetylase/succinyl-diaminopimelate desuccinylase-like protein n=1 Tax=Arcanobacterium wilhelmae TaxID=1803177 RepID=A0ABT9N8Z9_9ACTO|nr:dipeptidase [Arcanobacterium wilhelmae]MDP9800182.1 acetylornithine deacetylase/succinyl-diaminopimelate desuccinylase-like protein [Arcanobacterium wilhelmae]WFN89623.1 dipeptidase [Arcanobacterium wilhelmae]